MIPTSRNVMHLSIAMAAIFVAMLFRLAQVHVFSASEYRALAQHEHQALTTLPAKRGEILDVHWNTLVTSISSTEVFAYPNLIKNKQEVADNIGSKLGLSSDYLLDLFDRYPWFSWIKRRVSINELRELKSLDYDFLGYRNTYQRINIEGLSNKVIGYVNIDGKGISGLELMYDSYLSGTDGIVYLPKDALGRPIWSEMPQIVQPKDGSKVILTIDVQIQHIVEHHLSKAVEEKDALRGVAVAMDPHSGAILAIAEIEGRGNRSSSLWPINAVFEPGSIFKTITAYAALHEGVVSPGTIFETDWKIRVGNHTITNYNTGSRHVWRKTFAQALAQSDNVVFVTVAQMLGKEKLMEHIRRFGFGEKTGIDFPGEVSGLVPKTERVGPLELATISFGQGIAVTPIQMVRAYSAIVNGGYLVRPYLVETVINQDGTTVYQIEKTRVKTLDEEVADILKDMLTGVVISGTGRNAQVKGMSVGGKTGTAEKVINGVYSNRNIASFIGFAPVENPRIVLIVILDEPRKSPVQTGGYDAAPVFAAIMNDIARYWGIIN